MGVRKLNPRQYVAEIPNLPGLEVWFQRASDCVRKLSYGDIDMAIVGYDMFSEFSAHDDDLVVVHDALGFGGCHLALGIPTYGRFTDVNNVEELKAMGWSDEEPLRVVTGYNNLAAEYFTKLDIPHVILTADGALEAAPKMGCADIILDLVSTGTTMRENNLKEIVGGNVLDSQGVLVASKKALQQRPGMLDTVHEMIERLEAHLTAKNFFTIECNMRGDSEVQIAQKLIEAGLGGLEGPTISPVFATGGASRNTFAVTIAVRKVTLYSTIKEIRKMGGSGVLVSDLVYIFEEDPWRWKELQKQLK